MTYTSARGHTTMRPKSQPDTPHPLQLQHPPHAQHLDDAQFADLLLGAAPAAVSAHLAACPQCAQESARVSAAIGSFNAQSRLWAQRRASTPLARTPAPQPLLGWPPSPRAWAASAAALLVAVSLGLVHRTDAPPATRTPTLSAAALSPATLKADNDLLTAIHGELQANAAPPASVYGLDIGSDPALPPDKASN